MLDNAIKYTETAGKVVLSLNKKRMCAVVLVEDTGVGIATEHLRFIFRRFWRADKARFRRTESFGLGLAIASAIAKQHKGKITVSSKLGVGSCFEVYLPLERE